MNSFNNNGGRRRAPDPRVIQTERIVDGLLAKARQFVKSIDNDKHQLELLEPRFKMIQKAIKQKQRQLEDLLERANRYARRVRHLNRRSQGNVERFKARFRKYRNTSHNNNNYE